MLNIGKQRDGLVKKDLGNKMEILRSYCVDGEFFDRRLYLHSSGYGWT